MPLLHLARIRRERNQFDLAEQYLTQAEYALPTPAAHLAIACDVLLERAALNEALGHHEEANTAYWRCVQLQHPLETPRAGSRRLQRTRPDLHPSKPTGTSSRAPPRRTQAAPPLTRSVPARHHTHGTGRRTRRLRNPQRPNLSAQRFSPESRIPGQDARPGALAYG